MNISLRGVYHGAFGVFLVVCGSIYACQSTIPVNPPVYMSLPCHIPLEQLVDAFFLSKDKAVPYFKVLFKKYGTNIFLRLNKAGDESPVPLAHFAATSFKRSIDACNIIDTLACAGFNNFSAKNKDGLSPLYCVSRDGKVKRVSALLCAGVPADDTTEPMTPLGIAGLNNHHEVMRVLVKAGADVNYRSESGYTPLIAALRTKHAQVATIKKLIGFGANINLGNKTKNTTPLIVAAALGENRIIHCLLDSEETKANTDNAYEHKGQFCPISPSLNTQEALLSDTDWLGYIERDNAIIKQFLMETA